jgi:hypothetical protein
MAFVCGCLVAFQDVTVSACLAGQRACVSMIYRSSSPRDPSMAVTEHQSKLRTWSSCCVDCRFYSGSGVSGKKPWWCCHASGHRSRSHPSEDTSPSPCSRRSRWPYYQQTHLWCIYTLKVVSLPSEVTRPETHGGVVQWVKVRDTGPAATDLLPVQQGFNWSATQLGIFLSYRRFKSG